MQGQHLRSVQRSVNSSTLIVWSPSYEAVASRMNPLHGGPANDITRRGLRSVVEIWTGAPVLLRAGSKFHATPTLHQNLTPCALSDALQGKIAGMIVVTAAAVLVETGEHCPSIHGTDLKILKPRGCLPTSCNLTHSGSLSLNPPWRPWLDLCASLARPSDSACTASSSKCLSNSLAEALQMKEGAH